MRWYTNVLTFHLALESRSWSSQVPSDCASEAINPSTCCPMNDGWTLAFGWCYHIWGNRCTAALAAAKNMWIPWKTTTSRIANALPSLAVVIHLQRPETIRLPCPNRTHCMKFATWNVHTLMDSESRLERWTALVGHKLKRLDIDVAVLQETRLPAERKVSEMGCGYTFFWKALPEDQVIGQCSKQRLSVCW